MKTFSVEINCLRTWSDSRSISDGIALLQAMSPFSVRIKFNYLLILSMYIYRNILKLKVYHFKVSDSDVIE